MALLCITGGFIGAMVIAAFSGESITVDLTKLMAYGIAFGAWVIIMNLLAHIVKRLCPSKYPPPALWKTIAISLAIVYVVPLILLLPIFANPSLAYWAGVNTLALSCIAFHLGRGPIQPKEADIKA